MKTVLKTLAATGVVLALGASAAMATTVGGFGSPRTLSGDRYSIYGTNGANAELTNAANAGNYGDTISLKAGTETVTDTYLADVDIFVTGLVFDSKALSAAEVTSLTNFINDGGFVIGYGDNTSFDGTLDALMNNFGLDVDNTSSNSSSTTLSIDAPLHPIMSGPFGVVSNISIADSAFLAAASGDARNIASYVGGQGAVGVVGPNGTRKGGMIFLPDSETFGLGQMTFRGQDDARDLFNNAIAYAISEQTIPQTPLPAGMVLAASGFAALGALRRRQRRT